jgi:CDP-diacylglycerol--glycerol-3-phosphate 3-phosphatidyltransferase
VASVYDLKPKFQALLRPVMLVLRDVGVTPNHLTVLAILLSAATGVAIGLGNRYPKLLLFVPIALFVRMALNAIDGMMARECDLTSPLGMVLNELGDIVSDVVTFLPLIAFCERGSGAVVAFTMLSILCEFAGLLGVSLCGKRLYDGPMGKSDRAFAVGAISLALYWLPWVRHVLPVLFTALSAMLLVSIKNRVRSALTQLAPPPVP